MEENTEAWEIFLLLTTQLRVGGMGVILGLDFAAIEPIFNMRQIPLDERTFLLDKLAELSRVVVKYWNKKSEDNRRDSEV